MIFLCYNHQYNMRSAKLQNRILFFSPSVQAGWQKQSHRLDFEFIEQLGKGSFGVVHKVIHKKTKRIYAIKQIRKKALDNPKLIQQAKIEVKIMYSLNNPHIVKLYNHFEDDISIYLVIEFAAKGQLYKFMRSQPERKFKQEVASEYVRQVTEGIRAIHQQKIMHRDIKPENILITQDGVLKIADFGLSNSYGPQDRTTLCGTLDYLAPEMVQKGHTHNYQVDIWSIGVLIYELCTGESPFSQQLIKQNNLNEQRVKVNIQMVRYTLPEYLSDQCKDLIKKILVFDPNDRACIEQILLHPWICNKGKQNEVKKDTKDWVEALKKQMRQMFPQDPISQNSKQQFFSKQEIYNYTRPDSILNLRPLKPKKKPTMKKHQMHESVPEEQKISSNHQLQKKIKYLQKMHQQDQKQIRNLKSQQDHRFCQQELKRSNEQICRLKNQITSMNWKLEESEKKVKMYERKHFGF